MNELVGISQGIFPFLIIIFSIILHEIAHGIMGSVIVPLLAFLTAGTFFGWAKPVPYNPYNIRTRLGLAFVASAGILTNLLLAILAGFAFKMLLMQGLLTESIGKAIFTIITVNISLAFFNLIPIPPFDGMGIIEAFFPRINIRHTFIGNPLYMIGAILVPQNKKKYNTQRHRLLLIELIVLNKVLLLSV